MREYPRPWQSLCGMRARGVLRTALLICLIAMASTPAQARKTQGSEGCYRDGEPVRCFLKLAEARLGRITALEDRTDAITELLYAMAVTGQRSESILAEAGNLAKNAAVKPVKQMDLLYAIDLYGHGTNAMSAETYEAALRRFATLAGELEGNEQAELYAGACSIVAWDASMRERWLEFAQSVCTSDSLAALKPTAVSYQALVIAMMPVAMTLAENRDGFALAASHALSWLDEAERIARKSKQSGDREFVAYMGVLMHTLNALCLDAFDFPDASDEEVERARQVLRRIESRGGITSKSAYLRRVVIEAMFDTGREAEAKNLLRQLLVRVDSDQKGNRISLPEQIATLLLAARLEHYEQADAAGVCAPDEETRI
jgi:hypothetical protein